jgi:hypothetical protein
MIASTPWLIRPEESAVSDRVWAAPAGNRVAGPVNAASALNLTKLWAKMPWPSRSGHLRYRRCGPGPARCTQLGHAEPVRAQRFGRLFGRLRPLGYRRRGIRGIIGVGVPLRERLVDARPRDAGSAALADTNPGLSGAEHRGLGDAASAAAAFANPNPVRLAASDAFDAILTPSSATVSNRPNPNRAASINTSVNNCRHAP